MFNYNTFLNQYLSSSDDFTDIIKGAADAWEKGSVAWAAWVNGYLLKVSSIAFSGEGLSDFDFLTQSVRACHSNKLAFKDIQISADEDTFISHLQMTAELTDRKSGAITDYHICLACNKNLLSSNYALEIVSPDRQNDVTVCHCAEHKMKKFVPAFA